MEMKMYVYIFPDLPCVLCLEVYVCSGDQFRFLRCLRIDCVHSLSGDLSHIGSCMSRLQVGEIPAMD